MCHFNFSFNCCFDVCTFPLFDVTSSYSHIYCLLASFPSLVPGVPCTRLSHSQASLLPPAFDCILQFLETNLSLLYTCAGNTHFWYKGEQPLKENTLITIIAV